MGSDVSAARTLVDLLRLRAERHPEKRVFTFLEDVEPGALHLTYGDLDLRARIIAERLIEIGAHSQRALLLYPPGLEYICAFFGCLYAGVVAVPAYPPDLRALHRTLPRLQAVVRDATPTIALTNAAILPLAQTFSAELPDMAKLRWLATDELHERAGTWQPAALRPDSLAFLQYTSGSTGVPRGVMLSHRNLLENERMIARAFRLTEHSVACGWLPLYHDMGLIGNVIQPIFSGAQCVLMSPMAFLQSPFRWLQAITRFAVDSSGAPNFAYDLCVRKVTEEQRAELDLRSWTLAFCGAEPVRDQTLDRFAAAFAPVGFERNAFFPCYGLAEATLLVTGGSPDRSPVVKRMRRADLERGLAIEATEDGTPIVGCGQPVDGRLVVVHPSSGVPCAADEIGEIWLSAPSVAEGYWGDPAASAEVFQARLASGEGPFLRTGDLGFLLDGQLFVTGRLKDLIIIRGRNHAPQDIERTVESCHAALRPGCGAAFAVEASDDERLVVIWELSPRHEPDLDAVLERIRAAISQHHELRVDAVVLVRAGSIPKTSSGKIRRRECRAEFLSGRLTVVASWRSDDAELEVEHQPPAGSSARVLAIVSQRLAVAQAKIDPQAPITALGLDSLCATELQADLHAAFGVVVPLVELLEGLSVEALVRRLESSTSREQAPVTIPTTCDSGLSVGQEGLWFLHQWAPESPAYNVSIAARVRGTCQPDALRQALERLLNRHAALRTTLVTDGTLPRAIIHPRPSVDFRILDCQDGETREAALQADALRPFDLAAGPLFRTTLYRTGEGDVLSLCMHHSVTDLWSMAIVARDLAAFYREAVCGPAAELAPSRIEYADFVGWQRQMLAGPEGESHGAYWENQLDGAAATIALPTDHPRPITQRFLGEHRTLELDPLLSAQLETLASGRDTSLFALLLTCFHVLLFRYSGQDDVLIGVPTSGRTQPQWADVVGFFVNMIPVRARLSSELSLADALAQVRRTLLDGLRHQDFPFAKIVERLKVAREPSRASLVQVSFAFQQAPFAHDDSLDRFALRQPGARLSLGELELEAVPLRQTGALFDLALFAAKTHGRLVLQMKFDSALFGGETVERMLRNYEMLLRAAVDDPSRAIGQLALVSRDEHRMLQRWNETTASYPEHRCLHELFEGQAKRTPSAVAVVHGAQQLTYAELEAQSDQLANYLRQRGIGPGSLVGLCVERSVAMVVGLLGILKAGGAYVPLDPTYPSDRQTFMLNDSGAVLLLTQESLSHAWSSRAHAIVCLDRDWPTIAQTEQCRSSQPSRSDCLAYLIYTSGSTGRPKAVSITHRSATAFIAWATTAFSQSDLAGTLASTSICFDLSIFELFAPLACGGTVIVVTNVLELPRIALAEVTLLNTVPTAMAELLRSNGLPPSVRTINLAGEPLSDSLVQQIYERDHVERVFDLYGPSEYTTYATYGLRRKSDRSAPSRGAAMGADLPVGPHTPETIGRPLANTQIHILDPWQRHVPIGVYGEVYIGGAGLARGYLERPSLTAERFVPDPFGTEPGARLYRTGDLARWRFDGDLEFFGRVDSQVKLRGFRIELGEIESALGECPGLEKTLVSMHPSATGNELVAYFTAATTQETARLHSFLRTRLPEYMVPGTYVQLDAFPLLPNGKVDRKALPMPGRQRPAAVSSDPRSPTEEVLGALWTEALGLDHVGRDENFFQVGGHSLLANQVMARARAIFEIELPMRALFESPTVASLAARVDAAKAEESGRPRLSAEGAVCGPMSFGQERMWFLWQLDPEVATYNIPIAARLTGPLDRAALTRALERLIARHAVLRTTYGLEDGHRIQKVVDGWSGSLRVLPARPEELERILTTEARAPFDLEFGPVIRALLVELGPQDHVLVLTVHHVTSDEASMRMLLEQLAGHYSGLRCGEPEGRSTEASPQGPTYVDWSRWQRSWLNGETLKRGLAFWRSELSDAPRSLDLPADKPRTAVSSHRGEIVVRRFGADIVAAAREIARVAGATTFMTWLAALGIVLARASGQEEIVIGTPVSNRTPEVESLLGFMTNTLAIRVAVSRTASFADVLAGVKERVVRAYAHADVPLELVVTSLDLERGSNRPPLFQVMLAHADATLAEAARFDGLSTEPLPMHTATSKFELLLMVGEREDGAELSLEYSTELFERKTAERLLDGLERIMAVSATPESVGNVSLLSEAERRAAMKMSRGAIEPDWPNCLEAFEQHADREPSAVAVGWSDGEMTYGELEARANQIAHALRSRGVAREDRVGLCAHRGWEALACVLGIAKAGAALVALDPTYPLERLRSMLSQAGVRHALGHDDLRGRLPELSWTSVDSSSTLWRQPRDRITRTFADRQLLYVVFTSGSTGKPKGVAMEARCLWNFIAWGRRHLGRERAVTAQYTTLSFDVSYEELWLTWSTGGRLEIVSDDERRDSERLWDVLDTRGVERLFMPFVALEQLVDVIVERGRRPKMLSEVISAGEALKVNDRMRSVLQGIRLDNEYGPSETHGVSGCRLPSDAHLWESLPSIGSPVSNTRVYVLDDGLLPVAVGQVGELYVGGIAVGRGYDGAPELTAERFIPDPYDDGARMYRTGDRARYEPSGELTFLGRRDGQVKLRGYRIEPREIESVLREQPSVREGVVEVRGEGPRKQLVAYVVMECATDGATPSDDLRAALAARLPEYMVPTSWVQLAQLPLLPNGKVDRRALPTPSPTSEASEYVGPTNETEERLLELWKSVLGLERVSTMDDFFRIGGHSLMATQLVSRIRKDLGIDLPVRALFEAPTVVALAQRIRLQARNAEGPPQEEHGSRLEPAVDTIQRVDDMDESELDALLADLDVDKIG